MFPASSRVGGRLALLLLCTAAASACAGRAKPALLPVDPAAVRIVFVGDSLVHRSAEEHGMLDLIRADLAARHPRRTFELVDAGINGNRIADISERLFDDVLELHPDAVVLYWDSDVSDVDEHNMAPDEVRKVRADYEKDLRSVLGRLAGSGTHVVMSGPTLIGEKPRRRNEKDPQLDAYRAINRRVAASLRIEYVDTRQAFFARRPLNSPATVDRGLLTEDGEHLNEHGVALARSLFVRALDIWVRRLPPVPSIR